MRSAQQRSFIGLRHRHFSNHTTTEQDDSTIASERYLGEFRSEQQHCGSFSRDFPDQRVDLALRTDIDTTGGVKAQQSVEAVGEPTCNHNLLLVTAAQPAQF